ncbi:MAG: type II toxin-antitoxin system VapC family toxin [Magnetococcales bacterium]|nr:type II toxin-antitoxin system VapC family toxin [Magnetococcales bacterium]
MLLDSNLIIYAAQPGFETLRERLQGTSFAVSPISRIEVLGYHRIKPEHLAIYERLFSRFRLLPVTVPVVEGAVRLRQRRRMSLGDALVGATALEHGLKLWTRNVKDFVWIDGLRVYDPMNDSNISAG